MQYSGASRRVRGFTMVELITIIVITGILAATVAPRFFNRNAFDSRGFYDQVISTLRYAQKAAIAQRRFVCVAFTANSITLTYDPVAPGATHTAAACSANLTGPTGLSPHAVSSNNASFAAIPAAFNFDAHGRASAAQSIAVSGYAAPIAVESETGYVH
ncbi:MAG: prepilin-type N-terminal cleavage/methylation domain-containing protein [Nitrosomonadales bacterium]|nr:prepilin-type N-terminal cleavage/methylation domain-containing protein [Nitrosomonadales bacterium]